MHNPNLNPEFADSIRENLVMKEIPSPEVGQVWRHRNGMRYEILIVGIEAAGHLRNQNPSGYLHVYKCLRTGKMYTRLTDYWEKEMQSFTLENSDNG